MSHLQSMVNTLAMSITQHNHFTSSCKLSGLFSLLDSVGLSLFKGAVRKAKHSAVCELHHNCNENIDRSCSFFTQPAQTYCARIEITGMT